MEFESSRPVSDEDRRLAEAKKLVLQPIHLDVVPDDLADSLIAARHLTEPAIGNALNDTEESTTRILPTKSFATTRPLSKIQSYKLIIGISAGALIFSGLAVFAFLK
jgi:hypothetical protein